MMSYTSWFGFGSGNGEASVEDPRTRQLTEIFASIRHELSQSIQRRNESLEKGDTVSIVGEYGQYLVDDINNGHVTIKNPGRVTIKNPRPMPKKIVGVFPSHKLYKVPLRGSILERKEKALSDVLAAIQHYQQTMAHPSLRA